MPPAPSPAHTGALAPNETEHRLSRFPELDFPNDRTVHPSLRRPSASMNSRAVRLASILLALFVTELRAQRPVLELDHFYIVIQRPPSRAADALRHAGIVVDTAVTHHDGQGTASVAAFFENAYLELLWVDSTIAVDSAHLSDLADFRRATSWRDSGASPFGLGLHFLEGSADDVPIPVRREPAPHLGTEMFYLLLRRPEEPRAADLFVMPARAAVTQWMDRFRGRRPNLFAHPLGARRITRVTLHGSPANRPGAMDLDLRSLGFAVATTQYAIVEFDGAPQGREWDLRPVLPLVLRR